MSGNEHLIDRCHSPMYVMSEEQFMVYQESECMSNIELDITPGRKIEINNGKLKK